MAKEEPVTKAVATDLVGVIRQMRAKLDQCFDAMDRRFDGVDRRLEAIESRLDKVGAELEALQMQMAAISRCSEGTDRTQLALSIMQRARQSAIDNLAARVNLIERGRQN